MNKVDHLSTVNFTEFKKRLDTLDKREDQKALIFIRQVIKKSKKVKYRKKKLAWVIQLIKDLEFTKKSRGYRISEELDEDELIARNDQLRAERLENQRR